jgi:hypothetical protein
LATERPVIFLLEGYLAGGFNTGEDLARWMAGGFDRIGTFIGYDKESVFSGAINS